MNEKEYITIKEYATAKNISVQAVYKQLTTRLKDFLIEVEGRKCLKIEVLSVEVDNHVDNEFNDFQPNYSTDLIEILKSQITEKDKQITTLLLQIEQLQIQNANLTEIIKGHQVLLAMNTANKKEKKGIFRLFQKKETTEQE